MSEETKEPTLEEIVGNFVALQTQRQQVLGKLKAIESEMLKGKAELAFVDAKLLHLQAHLDSLAEENSKKEMLKQLGAD